MLDLGYMSYDQFTRQKEDQLLQNVGFGRIMEQRVPLESDFFFFLISNFVISFV